MCVLIIILLLMNIKSCFLPSNMYNTYNNCDIHVSIDYNKYNIQPMRSSKETLTH